MRTVYPVAPAYGDYVERLVRGTGRLGVCSARLQLQNVQHCIAWQHVTHAPCLNRIVFNGPDIPDPAVRRQGH